VISLKEQIRRYEKKNPPLTVCLMLPAGFNKVVQERERRQTEKESQYLVYSSNLAILLQGLAAADVVVIKEEGEQKQ
jgi:hypothetical protein